MFLPILLGQRNNTLTIYPYNFQIWTNILDTIIHILVNIGQIKINRFTKKITKIITIISNYCEQIIQVITGEGVYSQICIILPIALQNPPNTYQEYPSTIFLAISHEQNTPKFHDMSDIKQQEMLANIKLDYQEIMINYFLNDKNLPGKIDKFINTLFCANIPVPRIIEMHMEIIEEFAKQLRLEGRSDETLLDYRLTLIDILANLCELYRCSLAKPHS